MNTLSVSELQSLYKDCGESAKALLENKYGKDFFTDNWTQLFAAFCSKKNLVITHDTALARTDKKYAYLPHENPQTREEEHDNASRMIRKIIAVNNEEKGFVADYTNKDQKRWYPVFQMTSAGLVFCYTTYGCWYSNSNAVVGAPFVFPTSEEAKRIAIQYLPIYVKLHL